MHFWQFHYVFKNMKINVVKRTLIAIPEEQQHLQQWNVENTFNAKRFGQKVV